jgi:phosphate transport system substrate-binding protein
VRTPFALATSRSSARDIKRAELADWFADPAAEWADGKPLRIVLRARDDSDIGVLIDNFPGMEAALQAARKRRDVPIAATDQDNADLAQQIEGSLTGMTLIQISAERLSLRALTIDGVAPSVTSIADGSYSLVKTLCLVLPREPTAAASRFVEFARAAPGARIFAGLGALPADTGP